MFKYYKLNNLQKADFLKKISINIKDIKLLPRILISDVGLKTFVSENNLILEINDLIRIERPRYSGGTSFYYRRVVNE